jgi:plasmid stability protein
VVIVSTLTIRQLNEHTHARLRGRAAKHGRSVEAEVRAILDAAVNLPEENILLALHATFTEAGGVDLELPDRTDLPRPIDLS